MDKRIMTTVSILEIMGFRNSWGYVNYPLNEYWNEEGTRFIKFKDDGIFAYSETAAGPQLEMHLNFIPDPSLLIQLLKRTFYMNYIKGSGYWLYLDDIRNPKIGDWIVVRSYDEFISHIEKHGMPELISLDHDLGEEHTKFFFDMGGFASPPNPQEQDFMEKTGFDCAKWLVNYCMDNNCKLPFVTVHSANPVGSDNIVSLINNFKRHRGEEENCFRTKW